MTITPERLDGLEAVARAATRFRVNIRGRLILQIEEAYEVYSDPGHCGYPERNVCHRWRDARVHDLTIAARQALNGGLSRGR